MTRIGRLLEKCVQDGSRDTMREIAQLVRSGAPFAEPEASALAALLGWDDGIGHPDDVVALSSALDGLRADADANQRERLARMIEDEKDEDPNTNAGASAGTSAVSNASAGNWALLLERLRDPAVTLTMFEREWLARHVEPGKGGRRNVAQEPLLYWWFRHVEDLSPDDALKAIYAALGKKSAKDEVAVTKALQRAGNDNFDPGEWWHRNAQWYRDGVRSREIFPPVLRSKMPDFSTFLRNRTE